MNKKYIDFYNKFILQTKTLSDRRVSLNSDLQMKEILDTYLKKSETFVGGTLTGSLAC